jgi:hypothetical protein
MTSRKNVSRASRFRRPVPIRAQLAACVTEALEDRRLMAAQLITTGIGGAAADGASGEASVSADGRFVVFSSFATNLVAGDTNGKRDIFLFDRQSGTTVMVSKNPNDNAPGNGDSNLPIINQDGTFVAFSSRASNLITGDTAGFQDVFRYNIATHALQLVSATNAAGTTFANGNSSEPTISKDGNIVSFTSFAPNLGGVDGNAENDVYVRNMTTGSNELASVNTGNVAAGNKLSFDSWISEDGRYVTFRSDATNLVSGDTNGNRDTFLRDLTLNSTTLISVNLAGVSGNSGSESNAVSGDGRFVVFQSRATDLVGNDGNNNTDVFLRDTSNNTTRLLSINRFGTSSAGGFSEFPAMSQNGDYATFSSTAPDIATSDSNGREDVFLRDLKRGPLTLVSTNTGGVPANGRSFDPFLSRGGDFVVFTSDATDMAGIATGGKANIYLVATPPPNTSTDTQPPTVAFAGVQTANPGATTLDFTVGLSDNVGLDTVNVGALSVTKTGGGTFAANVVSVVGTGTSATATFRINFGTAVEANAGDYTVNVPGGAIKDAAGNSAAAGPIGVFNLAAGSGGGGGTIGDPNGPNLVITRPSKVPGEVIAGKKGKFSFRVNNLGPGLINTSVTTKVYLSADGAFDAGDTEVATVVKTLKLKVGKNKALKASFVYPTTIGDGNFFLLARTDSANAIAESNESDNVGLSATQVLVRQPFVDLQPTSVSKPSTLIAGGTATISAVIKNNGNVSFKGQTALQFVITPFTSGTVNETDTQLTTTVVNLSIKNGKTKTVKIKVPFPVGLAAATQYQVGLKVDSTNAFPESDEGNNIGLSFAFTT